MYSLHYERETRTASSRSPSEALLAEALRKARKFLSLFPLESDRANIELASPTTKANWAEKDFFRYEAIMKAIKP